MIQWHIFGINCPDSFGMEALPAKRIRSLGYKVISVEDGRVTFSEMNWLLQGKFMVENSRTCIGKDRRI